MQGGAGHPAVCCSPSTLCAPAHTTIHPGLCVAVLPRQVGLRRLHELWPGLTPQALGDSEPLHLSLAVKALGLSGPPKGF